MSALYLPQVPQVPLSSTRMPRVGILRGVGGAWAAPRGPCGRQSVCVCASFVKCPPALYVCCGVTNVLVGRPRCVDLAAQEVSHHQLIQLEAPQNHQNRRDRRPSSRSWPTRSVKKVGRGKRNRRKGGAKTSTARHKRPGTTLLRRFDALRSCTSQPATHTPPERLTTATK